MNDYYELNEIKNFSILSEDDQKRIKYLKIPPNWTSVKISKDPSSKIQVTGNDSKNRTQYIYHPAWVQFSKETKYSNINAINFNKLNSILKKYSNFEGSYTKKYIISNMIILMKDLNIRVGNEKYLEANDSVGLCTLSKKHYKIFKNNDKNISKFSFKGKKGVFHEKILDKYHISFIENIISLPGKLLFKYIDNESSKNNYKKITPDDLNQFLKDYIDQDMTCKDIRTYCANQIFKKEYSRLLKLGTSEKKSRIEATKLTAVELGNTPKVCRDSYIDPSNY
jgi:DNA topoisomerase I